MSQFNTTSVLEIQRMKREKREAERVLVTSKETGSLIVLDHKREFNPKIHELFQGQPDLEEVKIEEVVPVRVEAPVASVSEVSFADKVKADREELKGLVAKKAWLSSDAELKARHAELKAIYG